MKKTLLKFAVLLAIATTPAFAHEDVELGPNGGRILEFSKNESMHGEVTAKDGQFQIVLLDKEMKPVAIDKQTLTATSGDRNKPEKLNVEKADNRFVVPQLKGDDYWVIFQFREAPDAKPITARLHYETKTCGECSKAEWLCECGSKTKENKAKAK